MIAVAQQLIVLDGTIVGVALPSAEPHFHVAEANRTWS